ncbi:hypothetical protein HKBW3S42_00759 [Candidatus Hakubella thermalkaliphila]|uniref:Uncharacterized protein n=2 Tax=Candidatus Hakubella thermalkaliphila TaxID=2754717 RepID=A0A6V8PAG9_9ACTN|nr:hypothetical protein [Candidatus Hakubella thermalkaliphila]MBT9171394.1 hypothetical protein [Actinomycetota bacterium]GFP29278.1 hypothetical protein HKBW3S34_00197 [Candidatus Hakubella thermalkaliphila]GFP32455.1 hypothetical protein HKBW3S42_00759 [Candidatus Hakubella thermalkaliphila]GFP39215.1 hypothetical protein HKBW3S47_00915 [Candidatus Hakubella thermalkaliphila]GFP42909.1 hypothetical protein HKBW3C_02033 [Candidatus Hakubella thermalkaliphila]
MHIQFDSPKLRVFLEEYYTSRHQAIVAEVDVELLETDDEWSPYLSLEDAYKLDDVREALRRGDVKAAAQHGKVYTLTPVAM